MENCDAYSRMMCSNEVRWNLKGYSTLHGFINSANIYYVLLSMQLKCWPV